MKSAFPLSNWEIHVYDEQQMLYILCCLNIRPVAKKEFVLKLPLLLFQASQIALREVVISLKHLRDGATETSSP